MKRAIVGLIFALCVSANGSGLFFFSDYPVLQRKHLENFTLHGTSVVFSTVRGTALYLLDSTGSLSEILKASASVSDIYSFGDSLVYLTSWVKRDEKIVFRMGRFFPGSVHPVTEREFLHSSLYNLHWLVDERHMFYLVLDQNLKVLRLTDESIVAQVPLRSPCVPLSGLTAITGGFMALVDGDGKCLPQEGPRGWTLLAITPTSVIVTPLPRFSAADTAGRMRTLCVGGKAYVSIRRKSKTDVYEIDTTSADELDWVGSCSFLGDIEDVKDGRFLMVGTDTLAIIRRGERAEWR